MKKKTRNPALDIIRITALFCVISVHFFLNNEFYKQIIAGKRMYVATVARTGFIVCVPLFIMLTGYLMNKKTLCGKYYFGIVKTLAVYVLASVACIIFKCMVQGAEFTFFRAVESVMGFFGADYSWYMEMYIGLFLLIPFLNVLYNNLTSKKQKQILILTMLILTAVPAVFNVYNFSTEGWWKNPALSGDYTKILPFWWRMIYPLTYYFLGCFLKEFPVKIKKIPNVLLLCGAVLLFGSFNYYRSHGSMFVWGVYQDYCSLFTVILTVLLFVLLVNINCEKCPPKFASFLAKISDCCLGAYLVSYIFDQLFYSKLNAAVAMPERLNYYFVIVPLVFACSLILSAVLNLIYSMIYTIAAAIYRKCCSVPDPEKSADSKVS